MSQFNLSDKQSSTLIFSSDDLDEIFEVVQSILKDDGLDGLDGLSISVQNEESGEFDDYADEEIMLTLQSMRARAFVESHDRAKEVRPDR